MPKGYDKAALDIDILLDLPFREGVGGAATITRDVAKPHHPLELTGPPAWVTLASGLTVLDFDSANPDFLECAGADSVDLNFTTSDFSMAMWVYIASLAAHRNLIIRGGGGNTDGWQWNFRDSGAANFVTSQGGGNQTTRSTNTLVINTWYLLSLTRSGADVTLYQNAASAPLAITGTHVNPLTSARKLLIGIDDNETSKPFDGMLWRPRIWDRVARPDEFLSLFEMERHYLGV